MDKTELTYTNVVSVTELQEFAKIMAQPFQYLAIDTETTGLRPYHGDRIAGISVYIPSVERAWYFPHRHGSGNLGFVAWGILQDIFSENTDKTWVLFNSKFDMAFLERDGFALPQSIEEVMVAAKLLNENEYLSNFNTIAGAYGLKRLARKYLGAWAVEGEDALETEARSRGLNPKSQMFHLPSSSVAYYAAMDAFITWELREFYRPYLVQWDQFDAYKERNEFIYDVLYRMEKNGANIDLDQLLDLKASYENKSEALLEDINTLAKSVGMANLNPGSPAQVLPFLRLHGLKVDGTGKEHIMPLAKKGSVVAQKILDYRIAAKANSTYFNPYLDHMDENYKLHPNIHAMGTVTGRLSCSDPNLQQIPKHRYYSNTDYVPVQYEVKSVFVPSYGYTLVQIDYAQLELRLAVHYANEETMRRMFNEGEDMHQYTADQLGITRFEGKTANFSLLYGMGAKTGRVKLELDSEEEAKRIIEGWHKVYPAFRQASASAEALARTSRDETGQPGGKFKYIRLANDRIRHFHEFDRYNQNPPYYKAWNFIIQGTAAVIIDTSIHRVCREFDNDVLRPIMQVHDAFVFEVKNGAVDTVVPRVVEIMKDWPEFNPGLDVDVQMSDKSWGDM